MKRVGILSLIGILAYISANQFVCGHPIVGTIAAAGWAIAFTLNAVMQ